MFLLLWLIEQTEITNWICTNRDFPALLAASYAYGMWKFWNGCCSISRACQQERELVLAFSIQNPAFCNSLLYIASGLPFQYLAIIALYLFCPQWKCLFLRLADAARTEQTPTVRGKHRQSIAYIGKTLAPRYHLHITAHFTLGVLLSYNPHLLIGRGEGHLLMGRDPMWWSIRL